MHRYPLRLRSYLIEWVASATKARLRQERTFSGDLPGGFDFLRCVCCLTIPVWDPFSSVKTVSPTNAPCKSSCLTMPWFGLCWSRIRKYIARCIWVVDDPLGGDHPLPRLLDRHVSGNQDVIRWVEARAWSDYPVLLPQLLKERNPHLGDVLVNLFSSNSWRFLEFSKIAAFSAALLESQNYAIAGRSGKGQTSSLLVVFIEWHHAHARVRDLPRNERGVMALSYDVPASVAHSLEWTHLWLTLLHEHICGSLSCMNTSVYCAKWLSG